MKYDNKNELYITRTLSYSFIYKSVTYEYNEETNEIIPVYMNLSKMTNKGIISFFSEGFTNDNIVKKYLERYGKNEYHINMGITYFYFTKIEALYLLFTLIIQSIDLFFKDFILFIIVLAIVLLLLLTEFIITRKIIYNFYKKEYTLGGENTKLKVKRKIYENNNEDFYLEIKNCDLLPGDIFCLKTNDLVPCDCLIFKGECFVNEDVLNGNLDMYKKTSLRNNNEKFSYILNRNNI